MPLVLLDHPDSPNCHKVRLLLEALGQPYERRRIEFLRGETRTPGFLAAYPAGQLPVLLDDELALPESNAILVHLAARFAPARAGADDRGRAEVLRWLFWQASGPSRRIAAVGFQRRVRPARGEPVDEAAVAEELPRWYRDARPLEARLRGAAWLVGDAWTVADVGVGAWVECAASVGMLDELPATAAWLRRLQALPFWRRAPGYELLGGAS